MSQLDREQISKRTTLIGAVVNSFLGLIKILAGVFGQSSALVADGVHSLSDLICDGLVYLAAHYSHVDADENHPYGHRRFETFATLALGAFLIIVGGGIGLHAITSILHKHEEIPDVYTVWIAVISIVMNEWLYRYTMRKGNQINSDMLRANASHCRGDALSSIIVLVGLLGSLAGMPFLDSIAALLVAMLIIKMGLDWGWRSVNELIDEGVDAETLDQFHQVIINTDGVSETHQLRTRKMAEKVMLDVHVLVDPYCSVSEGHYIAECVRFNLRTQCPSVEDVTVHIDVYDDDYGDQLPKKMPPSRPKILAIMQPLWHEIVEEKYIRTVLLHYLDRRIEAQVVLDMSILKKRGVTYVGLQEQFAATAGQGVPLKSVTIVLQ